MATKTLTEYVGTITARLGLFLKFLALIIQDATLSLLVCIVKIKIPNVGTVVVRAS